MTEVVQSGIGQVPPSARDAVLARAARLSGAARAVLDAAALIGTRVEPVLLESVTGCPPAAVDELLASGLLTGDGDGAEVPARDRPAGRGGSRPGRTAVPR